MPAKSKAQQKAAGAALSAKRGETEKNDLKGPSKAMAESMTEKHAGGARFRDPQRQAGAHSRLM